MKALIVTATLFFGLAASAAVYFAVSDGGATYDMKLVLPVDTRQMPAVAPPPQVEGAANAEPAPVVAGRAETPEELREPEALVSTRSFQFEPDEADPGEPAATQDGRN